MNALAWAAVTLVAISGPSDSFAPGRWEVQSHLEAPSMSQKSPVMTNIVTLSDRVAAQSAATTFFSCFYYKQPRPIPRFQNGVISGNYYAPQADDLRAKKAPVTGTYSRDRFHVVTQIKAFGSIVYQILDGRLIPSARVGNGQPPSPAPGTAAHAC